MVSTPQFGFTQAEAEAFEAQLFWTQGNLPRRMQKPTRPCYRRPHTRAIAMAGRAGQPDKVIAEEFRKRFVDTKLFWETNHRRPVFQLPLPAF